VQGDPQFKIDCEQPNKQRSGIWPVPKSSRFSHKAQKM